MLAIPVFILTAYINAAILVILLSVDFFGFQYSWSEALVIGSLVAITDPVEMVHTLKHKGADKKFTTILELEGLLNDGSGIIIFFMCFSIA